MERYDYLSAVKNDVREYIIDNEIDVFNVNEGKLHDDLWCVDSVTGNGSGSYTFSTWQAEENLCHNFDLLAEVISEFGGDFSYLEKGAEFCDVSIRCWLLSRAISEVIEEMQEECDQDCEEL